MKMSTKKSRKISFIQSINECVIGEMRRNKNLVSFGLGINDRKRIFGSTKNLLESLGHLGFLMFQLQKIH